MSGLPPSQMEVTIFNKEYRVACPDGQETRLAEATDFLNRRIQEMKDSSAGLGTEQTAAITALNLAHDLLEQQREQQRRQSDGDKIHARLQTIKERLDANVLQQDSRRPQAGRLYQF